MPCEQIIEKHFKPFVLKEKTLPRHQCNVGVPVQHGAHERGTRAALAADEDRCVPPSARTAATLDLSRRLSLYGVHVRSPFSRNLRRRGRGRLRPRGYRSSASQTPQQRNGSPASATPSPPSPKCSASAAS